MKLDFLYICFAFALFFLMSCDSKSAAVSNMSAFEMGKSHLADGDRLREIDDELESKKFYQKAIIEFEKEVRLDSSRPGLARMLGIAQYRVRDIDNAIQWLTKASAQDKTDAQAPQYLGYCLVNKSKFQEADVQFQEAFARNKSGVVKGEILEDLMEIGEFSISLGTNFISQGNAQRGKQYQGLGMRIMAMSLELSKYDMGIAKKIETFAQSIQDQTLIDWIGNIIENDGQTEVEVKLK